MRISDWSSDVCSSDLPAAMPRWERVLARGTHILFYVLMIGVPLLGWAAASAGEAPPVPLYGVVPAPNLPVPLSHGLSETREHPQAHGQVDLYDLGPTCARGAQAPDRKSVV